MKLLKEVFDDVKMLVEETESGTKNYFIEGIFAQAEKANRNGRVYPSSLMENEINRYIQERVKTNRALGELNHPETPAINYEKACIKIEALNRNGNDYIGKAKVLDTPCGQIVKALIKDGVQMGVSTRGVGSLKQNKGIQEVQNDFRLSAIDVVEDPSAPDAFVAGLQEGKEWIFENGLWKEKQLTEALKTIKQPKFNEKKALRLFEEFIKTV